MLTARNQGNTWKNETHISNGCIDITMCYNCITHISEIVGGIT